MEDNKSAFGAEEYDIKIKKTLPYYDDFFEQIIELVDVCNYKTVKWLDVGCGTGKMAERALEKFKIEQFVCCDCSEKMLEIAKNRCPFSNVEFVLANLLNISYRNEFEIITAIQVNHYLQKEERKLALQKCYEALKENGLFISFENFAPFSELGKRLYLDKWKEYQIRQGKTVTECEKHRERYGKDYFPITLTEHISLMHDCGFRVVEILWISNMQVGIWGMK